MEPTRFELVRCECGHEYTRPAEGRFVLSCSKCAARAPIVVPLYADVTAASRNAHLDGRPIAVVPA